MRVYVRVIVALTNASYVSVSVYPRVYVYLYTYLCVYIDKHTHVDLDVYLYVVYVYLDVYLYVYAVVHTDLPKHFAAHAAGGADSFHEILGGRHMRTLA